ncbi:hypothetical protein DER46DRAFT_673487 [Fusarium sp. MPI-SDFR-AT-0072]|nr:hypothetical protein DER46DRAFT_673487 [Fusarium sp. MPI-SDFR-AT-0072]
MAGLPVSNITAITYNGSDPDKRPIDDDGKPYWQTKPSAHWRFVEARFGNSRFGDTGRTYRAMLPFRDEASRTKLESYSGPAIVANTRALCAPMPLNNSTFNATAHSWNSLKEIRLQEGEDKLEPEYYNLRKIVVLNITDHFDSIYDDIKVENGTFPDRLQKLSSKADDLWTRIYDSTGVEVMAASACYYNIRQPGLYHVNMSGKAITQETVWNENSTEAILLQLGIGSNARDEGSREILKLEIGSFMDRDVSVLYRPFYDVLDKGTMWNMKLGWSQLPEYTHLEHNLVFRDVIEQTGDLVLAIQAVLTRLFQMTYYYLMDEYNVAVLIATTHSVTMLIPAVAHAGSKNKDFKAADTALDKEVESWTKATGRDREIFILSCTTDGDKVKLSRKNRRTMEENLP